MGFAGHLRYHWMETIVYRSLEYIPLALLGINLYDFFIIHLMTLAIGHFNHSNISVKGIYSAGAVGVFAAVIIIQELQMDVFGKITWMIGIPLVFAFALGPWMKYIFNSPEMHIWHHSYELPKGYPYGINFGISLALWDYIFGTAVIPSDGRDIKLGFPEVEKFPKGFFGQITHGIIPRKKS
jgi:sterol desaturase/sphingolipid hydroxylase (fatty acid hydroxylase superfamily)